MTNDEIIYFFVTIRVKDRIEKIKYKLAELIIITKSTSFTVESMTFLDTDRSMTCYKIDL